MQWHHEGRGGIFGAIKPGTRGPHRDAWQQSPPVTIMNVMKEEKMDYKPKLTKERRRSVCVHEAGHAVISALCGIFVFRVAVAPEGAESWEIESRKGKMMTDLWGVCFTSDAPIDIGLLLEWSEEDGFYRVNRQNEQLMGGFEILQEARHVAYVRHKLRAHICGLLAGPLAEQIYEDEGVSVSFPDGGDPAGDIEIAMGLSRLIQSLRGVEFDHAARITEAALMNPEVWAMVLRLADELERVGDIDEGLEAFLPAKVPDWPTSPLARKERPFIVRPMEI